MEIWDAYKEDETLAGIDLIRGEKIPKGLYLKGYTMAYQRSLFYI